MHAYCILVSQLICTPTFWERAFSFYSEEKGKLRGYTVSSEEQALLALSDHQGPLLIADGSRTAQKGLDSQCHHPMLI